MLGFRAGKGTRAVCGTASDAAVASARADAAEARQALAEAVRKAAEREASVMAAKRSLQKLERRALSALDRKRPAQEIAALRKEISEADARLMHGERLLASLRTDAARARIAMEAALDRLSLAVAERNSGRGASHRGGKASVKGRVATPAKTGSREMGESK